jgi:DNA-binding NtrC family response regulator
VTERLLIVEDEETLRESLRRVLIQEGYEVDSVGSSEAALRTLDEKNYNLIITDIILPGVNGIQLLKKCREKNPEVKFIIITAFASIETAVEAIRSGAFDYLVKPIQHQEIKDTIKKALQS